MDRDIQNQVAQLAVDRTSGASELLPRAIRLLEEARLRNSALLEEVAIEICRAQPTMAPLRLAGALALSGGDRLSRFVQQVMRAGEAIARVAVQHFSVREPAREEASPLPLITCSYSGTVLACIRALGMVRPVKLACAEGRPAFEGRRLAAAAAGLGVAVDLYTDAAVSGALGPGTVVLVGADAVGPDAFLNKCGTLQLAATAAWAGLPVYLVAGREKFLPPMLAELASGSDEDPGEVWNTPAPGVHVRNRYFERIPLDLLTSLITDVGVLPVEASEELCRANGRTLEPRAVALLRTAGTFWKEFF